ncbi:hypothetical protein Glove_200g23 [Diversispora epigaea]|uniref:Uncharacterized protein n=1 Tax=Diversispora epigaea TaxID=1348612 RepID=A0A397IMZ9_9GLOM|nr:hypothetical protein Glove_200g23 [Diversispora epigaea]
MREKNKKKKLGSQDPLSYNSQSNKNKVEKFVTKISKNSSLSISNAESNVIPITLNETEESKTRCEASSQSSNTNFTFLYEKLCNAIIFANHKNQEAIFCYCNFGKALIQRLNELAS